MKAKDLAIIALLVSNAFLLALLVVGRSPVPPANAQTVASIGSLTMLSAGAEGDPTLFLIDTEKNKMAVYTVVSGSRPLRLIAVRDMSYDFLPDEFNDTSGLNVEQIKEYLSNKAGAK